MGTWIQIAISLMVLISITWFAVFTLGTILDEYFKAKHTKQFENDFKAAVICSQPTWEEMKEIARTRLLSPNDVQHIYKRAMRSILTGENGELSAHKDLIRSYIEKHKEEEPFEGIPNDIRIHLERLREKINDQKEILDPLTNQIKDLLTINEKDKKHQKYYTIGGFFIGLLGFFFAVYSYFLSPNSPVIATEHQQVENPAQQEATHKHNQPTQKNGAANR